MHFSIIGSHARFFLLTLFFIPLVKNWPLLLFSAWKIISFPKNDLILLRNGLKLACLDRVDAISLIEIFQLNEYRFHSEGIRTVIDIGANYGSFSLYAANQSKNIKVYSYEPSKETFKLLLTSIKRNSLQKQIIPINKAVSSKKRKIRLYNFGRSGTRTILPNEHSLTSEIVSTITLDDVLKKNNILNCDFLKMDCEGAEYDILLHTSSSTFKKIERISLEYHLFPPNPPVDVLVTKLKKEGFIVEVKRDIFVPTVGYLFAWKSPKRINLHHKR